MWWWQRMREIIIILTFRKWVIIYRATISVSEIKSLWGESVISWWSSMEWLGWDRRIKNGGIYLIIFETCGTHRCDRSNSFILYIILNLKYMRTKKETLRDINVIENDLLWEKNKKAKYFLEKRLVLLVKLKGLF